jgi:hypothetical protein
LTLLFSRLAFKGRKAVEESVRDGACVKQVLDGTQHGAVLFRNSASGLIYWAIIGPLGGNHGLTAVRQDQDEVQAAIAMELAENLE